MSTMIKAERTPAEREMIRQEVLAREIAAFDRYVMEQDMKKSRPKMPEHDKQVDSPQSRRT